MVCSFTLALCLSDSGVNSNGFTSPLITDTCFLEEYGKYLPDRANAFLFQLPEDINYQSDKLTTSFDGINEDKIGLKEMKQHSSNELVAGHLNINSTRNKL